MRVPLRFGKGVRGAIALAAAAICVTGVAIAPSASATTTMVACSGLQSAMNNAQNGDVIELSGTCVNGHFTITNGNAYTLEGVGSGSDGTPSSGFNGNLNNNATAIESVPGVNAKLTIENLFFTNMGSFYGGSAINIAGPGEAVTIKDDTFSGVSAGGGKYFAYGGAVEIDSGDGTGSSSPTVISGNTFTGDTANDGGAVYVKTGGALEVTNNTFTGNSVRAFASGYPYGGALDVEDYEGPPYMNSPITISNNTFGGMATGAGNSAPAWGGAAFVSVQGGETISEPAQTVTLTGNKFIDNKVTGEANFDLVGAGIAFDPQLREFGFNVVQSGNVFSGNTISGAVTSGNVAGGAGEWVTGTNVTSTADVFTGNQLNVTGTPTPAPEGGALGIRGIDQTIGTSSTTTPLHASFTGADDVFLNNSASSPNSWGGAIYTGGSTGNFCASTCPSSSLALYDSTIAGNTVSSSSGEGAAIWGAPGDSLTLENSIAYGNTGVSGAPEIVGYATPTYKYTDGCTTPLSGTPLAGTGNICADPKLNATGEETASSPTLDKGSNALVPSGLATDFEGHPRISGSCPTPVVDIGAFELKGACSTTSGGGTTTTTTTTTPTTTTTSTSTRNATNISTTHTTSGATTSTGTSVSSTGSGGGTGSTGSTGSSAGTTTTTASSGSGAAAAARGTPPPTGSEAAKRAATALALACSGAKLTLTDVVARGGRVLISGEAQPALAGHKVTILFEGHKRVATTRVAASGTFAATAPLPPAPLRMSNEARYEARIGSLRSAALKLSRRLIIDTPVARQREINLSGKVLLPLTKPPAPITVTESSSCAGGKTVGTIHPSRSGRYSVTIAAPAGADAVIVRLSTRVRESTHNPATFATDSLPQVVGL